MAAPLKPSPSVTTAVAPPPGEEAEKLNVVETPTSPSSGLVLSRFEFETGKGNEGTKILMVDWDTSVTAVATNEAAGPGAAAGGDHNSLDDEAEASADWEVSWEGKTIVHPIRDSEASLESSANRRVYFLLPPGAPIPPLVTVSKGRRGPVLHTKPMPAIFHPDLGVDTRDVGVRGVLHTLWAKKRLPELQAEIDREMRSNGESVGLEMALNERQWILEGFGLPASYVAAAGPERLAPPPPPASPASPTTPRSPIGGRLGEKLKGLKLATSSSELAAASHASSRAQISSLSPQAADVAVSSYPMFHGLTVPAPSGKGPAVGSLDAMIGGGAAAAAAGSPGLTTQDSGDTEEDLFALPMSPRSPEMKRSPFSML